MQNFIDASTSWRWANDSIPSSAYQRHLIYKLILALDTFKSSAILILPCGQSFSLLQHPCVAQRSSNLPVRAHTHHCGLPTFSRADYCLNRDYLSPPHIVRCLRYNANLSESPQVCGHLTAWGNVLCGQRTFFSPLHNTIREDGENNRLSSRMYFICKRLYSATA